MRTRTPGTLSRRDVDPSALAGLEHENWIEYLAASVSLSAHGLFIRDRGIVTLLGHVPMRFFNQILVEDPAATASAIGDAVTLGRARRDPFVVSLREGLDDRFTPLMAELGLVASDDAATQAMTLYPVRDRERSIDPDPGFEIRRVTDAAGLADHRRTVTCRLRRRPIGRRGDDGMPVSSTDPSVPSMSATSTACR